MAALRLLPGPRRPSHGDLPDLPLGVVPTTARRRRQEHVGLALRASQLANHWAQATEDRSPLEPNPPIPVRADPDVFTIINGSALSNKSQLSDGTGTLGRR